MTLLLLTALGVVLWRWLGMTRPELAGSALACVGTTTPSCAGRLRDRSWIVRRPSRRQLPIAAISGVLTGTVAATFLTVQSRGVAGLYQQVTAPQASANSPAFYLQRGESFSDAHQYDRAIADYTMAIQLKPDYAEAYNDRGFAYYLKGDAERAIADYTRAIELRPNYPRAYNNRGVTYMARGYGSAKAVPDFDRAIALQPDFRYAYINRANARLASHPWLALRDFHSAGMYPERTIAKLASVIIVMALGIVWLRRKRRRMSRRTSV